MHYEVIIDKCTMRSVSSIYCLYFSFALIVGLQTSVTVIFFYHHCDMVSSHDTFNLAWPAAPRVVVSFLQRSTIPYGVKATRRYIRELGGAIHLDHASKWLAGHPTLRVCVSPALCEIVASLCGIPSSSRVDDITPCCREALAE
jgi:hypothetical protein